MRRFLILAVLIAAPILTNCSSSSDGGVITPSGPDPACSDQTGNRFVDCRNGTVTDTQTGLIWLKDASCLGFASFGDANQLAADLGEGTHAACNLTDGSSPGDWRLPTLACPSGSVCSFATPPTGEFATIFAASCTAPFVLDTAGTGCWSEGNPFSRVQSDGYISSTMDASIPGGAWFVSMINGIVFVGDTEEPDAEDWVWPVRGGL